MYYTEKEEEKAGMGWTRTITSSLLIDNRATTRDEVCWGKRMVKAIFCVSFSGL